MKRLIFLWLTSTVIGLFGFSTPLLSAQSDNLLAQDETPVLPSELDTSGTSTPAPVQQQEVKKAPEALPTKLPNNTVTNGKKSNPPSQVAPPASTQVQEAANGVKATPPPASTPVQEAANGVKATPASNKEAAKDTAATAKPVKSSETSAVAVPKNEVPKNVISDKKNKVQDKGGESKEPLNLVDTKKGSDAKSSDIPSTATTAPKSGSSSNSSTGISKKKELAAPVAPLPDSTIKTNDMVKDAGSLAAPGKKNTKMPPTKTNMPEPALMGGKSAPGGDSGIHDDASKPKMPLINALEANGELKGAAAVPAGEELVSMDFSENTDIQDIIKAVALWTGRNVIIDRNVTGKIQILSPKKVTKEEAYQAFLSSLNVLGLTVVETGKVIKIMKVRDAVRDNLETYMGANWAPRTDKIITQIIPLKYIDSKQITQTLSRIVSTPSAIIPYEPTNTLIMSDTGYKVKRVLDIIALLDVESEQPKVVMVPIKFSDAKGIADKVNQILQTAGQASGKANMRSYKVLVDDRTNSVIIFGPPRTIEDVKELVKKFDVTVEDPSTQATIHVRPLDYADAKKLATTLSSLAGGSKSGSRRPPMLSGPPTPGSPGGNDATVADLGDNTKITSDESTNSLLITGSRASYNALNSIIRKLDVRRSQVFIEVDILDMNTTNDFKAGTSIFAGVANKDGSGTKSIIGWQTQDGMAPLITAIASTGDGAAPNPTTIGQAAQAFQNNLAVGILSGAQIKVPGIGTLTPGAIINLMKEDVSNRSLSSPNILTSNNEEATVTSGQKFLYKTANITSTGVSSETVQKEDVDTTLTVKPNISNSNYVTLDFKVEANRVIGQNGNVPNVGKRSTKQKVTVKSGQTVVISGMMQDFEQEKYQKIPLLGDIPVLGWLFRNTTTTKSKNNLVIFITPHIVHGAEDLAVIYKRKLKERDEYFEAVFGRRYANNDFYRSLPNEEAGQYKPTREDLLEDKRQAKTNEELRKMMDAGANNNNSENNNNLNGKDDALTVPVPGGGDISEPASPATPPPVAPNPEEEQPLPLSE